ncbi:hypothetical protein FD723_10400 [Nostoc sp. C052]|uniref:hypothetical protein n=1 Tax=Nostoc sp. C052 TaxID=2576902 RepID=UPI0015C3613F|nr:hypothetical protein [Nostoc sp. C052]QLE40830.1 hypothetical protein FD723_10400 [Nostoc sp. C052]
MSNSKGRTQNSLRELQEINYPILWRGHLARHINWAGKMPTPQEGIGYFFIWKSLTSLRDLGIGLCVEWHKEKAKGLCHLVPSLQTGNVFQEALPLVSPLEAEPPRMGSQPGGWEPVRAKLIAFLSAIRLCVPNPQFPY